MNEWPRRADEPAGLNRRAFLAAAGTAALAGCSTLRDSLTGSDEPERVVLEGSAIREMATTDAPTIPRQLPVEIEAEFLDGMAARARKYLSAAPESLAEEIPNEAVRNEFVEHRERAREGLFRADVVESAYESMDELSSARVDARFVAAAWTTFDSGSVRKDLRSELTDLGEEFERFRSEWAYVGADPIAAVLVHEAIEDRISVITAYTDGDREESRSRPDHPVAVGEFARRVERAAAALDTGSYLFSRYTDSVNQPRDLRSRFEYTAESIHETAESHRRDFPEVDYSEPNGLVERNIEGTLAAQVLGELYQDADRGSGFDSGRRNELAGAVLSGLYDLVQVYAFETVQETVENGEDYTIDDASDVVDLRESAVKAIREALSRDSPSAYPGLIRHVVADFARDVEYADQKIDDRGEITAQEAEYYAYDYAIAAALAREVPEAAARVGDELTGA